MTLVGRTGLRPDLPGPSPVPWRATRIGLLAVPLGIFAVSRVVDAVLISHAADGQTIHIGAGAAPPYPQVGDQGYSDVVTTWDGQWYRSIAEDGYPDRLPREDGAVEQNSWIFLPLYPSLVRLVMLVAHLSFPIAATATSVVCAAAAMCVVFRLVLARSTTFTAGMTVLVLSFFPAAPILQAAYSEGLGMLLLSLCLLALTRRRYGWLSVLVVLLSLTRAIVLPFVAVVAVHAVLRWRRSPDGLGRSETLRLLGVLVAAVAGFFLWPAVAAWRTGEVGAYFETRAAWVQETDRPSSWLGHVVTGDGAAAVLPLLALGLLAVVVLRPRAAAWLPELRTWALAYSLFILAATNTGGGALRYSMLALVPWWPVLPRPGESDTRAARTLLVAVVCVVGAAAQHWWISWYLVTGPSSHGFP